MGERTGQAWFSSPGDSGRGYRRENPLGSKPHHLAGQLRNLGLRGPRRWGRFRSMGPGEPQRASVIPPVPVSRSPCRGRYFSYILQSSKSLPNIRHSVFILQYCFIISHTRAHLFPQHLIRFPGNGKAICFFMDFLSVRNPTPFQSF